MSYLQIDLDLRNYIRQESKGAYDFFCNLLTECSYKLSIVELRRSAQYLANKFGISRSTVHRHINILEKLRVIKRQLSHWGGPNIYTICKSIKDLFVTKSDMYNICDPVAQMTLQLCQNGDTKDQEFSPKEKNNLIKTTRSDTEMLTTPTPSICDQKSDEPKEASFAPVEQPQKYQETYYPMSKSSDQYPTNDIDTKYANDSFEVFWELYPLKKDRRTAHNLWMQQGCYIQAGMIIEKLCLQISQDIKFINGYIPTPANYIRGYRWEDEIELARTKNNNNGKSKPLYDDSDLGWIENFMADPLNNRN